MLLKLCKSFCNTQIINRNLYITKRLLTKDRDQPSDVKPPPQIPLMCCGSGCSNCVWIQYTDELLKYYEENSKKRKMALKKALEEIQKIEDVNLRDFLTMEIKMKMK
ncbi:unnamed protein product [Brachionus calyciflorus]|uniref:Oxidoreductase-like domain-containing protein n=1 Tax=Brachionus calyciflorus TaxID=104777 RepID=A0A813LZC4_9BILA|nr:unnamed protein product [Brachionus calyciflorus]